MKTNDLVGDASVDTVAELEKLANQYGMDFLAVVSDEMLDPLLVSKLPVEWARSNCLLPVRIDGGLCVLGCDPAQVGEQEYLSLLLCDDLRPVLVPREVIAQSIERCYYSKEDTPGEFLRDIAADAENGSGVSVLGSSVIGAEDLFHVSDKTPVTQLVNLILLEAVKRHASDIHFEPSDDRLRMRYRIDGILYEQSAPPKHLEDALVSRLKVMARMDIAEKRLPQDGMARVRVGTREVDIRVSTVPVAEGERVVLRLLERDSAFLPLVELGMSGGSLHAFESLLAEARGMIVVSGPTGAGKTTTLYAALGQLDASRKNILTIEDPIEYRLQDIGQIQVKPKIGLTFATGLRHILRQDPDIVLVGETRDVETAEIAMRASLTGHLVLTTLHTNDAAGVALRFIDMGVEPYLLASCMRGALAQRLARKLCPACAVELTASEDDVRLLGTGGKRIIGKTIRRAVGCSQCLEGYSGRVGLFEVLVLDAEIQEMIRSGNIAGDVLRSHAEQAGMSTLLADGVEKIENGITSIDEVVNAASG
ncbi:MAG: type II/IV secretion system protein [Kiritimatiellae bacterium]|nr:type II/IV secretion system protein [Kiritimatiellia bacterium]